MAAPSLSESFSNPSSPDPPAGPPAFVRQSPVGSGPLLAEVAALRGEVRGLGAEVRSLGSEVRRLGRTDWPAVLTAGGLAATVLAGLGALALDPLKAEAARIRTEAHDRAADHAAALQDVRGEVHTLAGEMRTHAVGGHPAANARLDALERDRRP
ncbi:hypothetical protein [Alienimonas californiensis]|uniref:Uncharacterized protein n=1 Tax=Alienimonas californiensis TaxID=2527989 RepID=A0A517P6V5_9PLAN|nr:hypothetical protein [Alienimonas californiensis]QDT15093.1 hypothetical protein CA12_11740 [Alienimonas californiensis]